MSELFMKQDNPGSYEKLSREQMIEKLYDQKRALNSVRHSFYTSPVGMYIVQDRLFVWTNAKFQDITGYSGDELLHINASDLVIAEDRNRVRETAMKMLKGELTAPYQFRILDKHRDVHWIAESVVSIDFNGKRAVMGTFLDISETEGLKLAFAGSPIGIYIVQNGVFSYVNPIFQQMSGYDESELIGKPPSMLVFPDDLDHVRQHAAGMLKGELKEPYYFRVKQKSGKILWIMETVTSIRYHNERAVQGNFMDVTETRKIQEALKESEKKYRSLFELAREGIVIVSYDQGYILDFNREFENQTGYDEYTLKAMQIWEIQPPEFQEEARQSFFRFRDSYGGIVSWKLCQRKEGRLVSVEIVTQKTTMDGREVIFCMVRDTTERESLMHALSQASEEWRRSFDAIDDAVLIIDPDFRIHKANLAAARLLSMDVRRLIGEKCHELFHQSASPPDFCPHLTAQSKGVYCEAECEEPNWGKIFHYSASPMKDESGKVSRTVEIITDVSSRRKTERESARLSQALGDSFQGITESLSDLAESRDPYTAGHSRHVARLSVLAGEEMGLAQDDLHGLQICAILHDIGKVIIPAAILNKPGMLSEHEWGLIRAHPTTAFETLRHIPFPWPVADVVHQHHERLNGSGYPLGLKGSQIHQWARIIAVADLVDAITSHRPYRPSLPKQNALDELLKGRGVLYDPNVVDVFLKVLKVDDKRILVIDDDTDILNSLVEVLHSDGFDARGYSEAAGALKAFAEKPYPLVIVELNLLDMDGARLTRKVKEIDQNTEVIVTTRYGAKEETLRALRAGASDFLEKPMDLHIFRKSVKRALQRFAGKVQYRI